MQEIILKKLNFYQLLFKYSKTSGHLNQINNVLSFINNEMFIKFYVEFDTHRRIYDSNVTYQLT